MWKSTGLIAAAGLLTALLAACVEPARLHAAEPASHTPIVLGGDHSYPPFAFLDAAGKPTGFDVELFDAVCRQAGLQPRVELSDWEKALARLEAGTVHVVPMLVSDKRTQRFHFSQPFLHRHHLVFGPAGADYVESLDELAGHRVAVQAAGLAWEELRTAPRLQIIEVDEEGAALQAVKDGKADYAVVPSFIGFEAIRRYRLRRVVALSPPLLEREYAFAVSPHHPELLGRINAGLKAATRNGTQSDLYMKWLANLVPSQEVYRSGLALGLAVALVVLIAAVVLLVHWLLARRRAAEESLARARAEARALQLERFDPGTRLANRSAFAEAVQPLIEAGQPFTLVTLDLLELDAVQSMAGYGFADELLQHVADRLRNIYGETSVAKIGAARFAVVCPKALGARDTDARLARLVQSLKERCEISGIPVEQASRAGAAVFPVHGHTFEELLRNAGLALADAHARAVPYVVYDAVLEPDPRNLTLLVDLREAIRDGTLGYALQPKLSLSSGRVIGAELLVRWRHASYGALSPAEFVPLAEKTEVIGEMTVYLVRRAIAQLEAWSGERGDLNLAVNVSVNDLADALVVEQIMDACRDHGRRLIVEVTETAVMRDPARTLMAIERLRGSGLRVALDDFGTGNASLSYLRQLRPDEVKIDRSFIARVVASPADQAIVRSTIDLAHALGAHVTAEGVEDEATLHWLATVGCDCAQGYLIARPMLREEFERFMCSDEGISFGSSFPRASRH